MTIGIINEKLATCPSSPNCVSSQCDQNIKRMQPLKFTGSAEQAKQILLEILNAIPRTQIVTQTEKYLHAEVRSLLMRYVDDVEFLIDPGNQQIDFRSASRIGYSDFGVNRARMEKITQQFGQRLSDLRGEKIA